MPGFFVHTSPAALRHPQLDHHVLGPLVVDQVMPMQEQPSVFFKVRARHRLPPRTIRIQRRCPQHNVRAIKRRTTIAGKELNRVVKWHRKSTHNQLIFQAVDPSAIVKRPRRRHS